MGYGNTNEERKGFPHESQGDGFAGGRFWT